MNKHSAICFGGNILQYILTSIQTDYIFQIVEMALAILTSVVLLAYRIWHWYRESKEDGKITKEEIKEGSNILKEGIEDIKNQIDEEKNKHD